MHTLLIQLLGNFRVRCDDVLVNFNSQRLQDFLVYLLLHRGASQNRHQLAYLFWPESSDAQAQTNLRNIIYLLRKEFAAVDDFLTTDSQHVLWNPDRAISLDVDQFELLAELANQIENSPDLESLELILESAVGLYSGDLVPSCYADWIIPHRNKIYQLYISLLERLSSVKERRSKHRESVDIAHRLLKLEPLREANYRNLIRLYSIVGDRAAMVCTYHDCVRTLRHELNIEPSITTSQLYERLIRMDLASLQQRQAVPDLFRSFPLVGRQKEWSQLLAVWQKVIEGNTCFALINGDTGFGKTRLGEEFISWAEQSSIRTASARCDPADSNIAYAPIISWIRSKPLPSLNTHELAEIARICPEVLIERQDIEKPGALSQKWQLQHFFEALKHVFFADQMPFILFLDDLEWIDQESLEWLYYTVRFAETLPLLIIATLCPANLVDKEHIALFLSAMQRSGQLFEIELSPLDMEQTAILGRQLSNGEFSSSWASTLYKETDGIPLFVVELIRSGWKTDVQNRADATGGYLSQNLPPNIDASIKNRLASLSPQARELMGLAASIGHRISFAVLAPASGLPENLLVQALDELTRRHILREADSETYIFTPTKLRDVIYASLSSARKRIYHRQVTSRTAF
jgi:DNA-binding SARP family transcriptional activator